ncbi:hypothetical protein F4820DRAFT_154645 [Hypoxylon rubiginosum]|uniref:Uncharacterized protein n=1 Tax=Hypoxylon rubiginosum TaxID=110542 RepID=A0ACB9ZB39_9PEZI|nr:hypothetical protein F4820DRAFT_154645 [Hypoxylon rubiginosum]
MLSQSLLLAPLALFGTAVAAPSSLQPSPRAAQICYDSETASLLCYTAPDNTPQDVVVSDVTYIASYLRAYGAQTKAGRLYTMAAADAPDCGEWTIYAHGSAQAIAKHIDNTVNTSVLFADIANTIDGGTGATPAQQAGALIGCGTNGGSYGVVYNASNAAYSASTYPAGYTPAGILVKVVATGA